MKMVKSLLLGSAAGVVAMAGAQAADLPVKAHPVQYVKICSLYGAGFYYIPGTDTCIKIGGFMRAEVNFDSGGSYSVMNSGAFGNYNNPKTEWWRSRAGISADVRSQTEYGTLRGYVMIASTSNNGGAGGTGGGTFAGPGVGNPGTSGNDPYTALWSNAAFIQWAGFTAGKTGSFFDFDTQGYSNQTNYWGSNLAGGGIDLFAYTAEFGNGLSASISAETPNGHRTNVLGVSTTTSTPTTSFGTWSYGNQQIPDIVGNLRIDQAWGSAQVMAAYHQIDAMSTTTASAAQLTANTGGYAVGGGLKVNLPMLGKDDNVIAQVTYAEGAMLYVGSNAGGFALTNKNGTTLYAGTASDAIISGTSTVNKTSGWSITGGYEHHWDPMWKTSLYGAYGTMEYNAAATAVLDNVAGVGAAASANWDYYQVGSRTVWTPVENLDLSVDVMYNHLDGAYELPGNAYADKSWVSGMFRVQRNFWP